MAWVRIDDNAPHHRKHLRAGPAACWLWVCGLAYCQRLATDGFIPLEAVPTLGVGSWKKLAGFLVTAGLWHKESTGYRVHDYLAWNDSKDERDRKATEKKDRQHRWIEDKRRARDASRDASKDAPETRRTSTRETLHHSPSTPLHSTPPPKREAGGIIVGPLHYAKLLEKNAFVGARLRVPHVLHDELRTKLGGVNPDAKLRAWYTQLDVGLDLSGEPIPDVFQWLRPQFVTWCEAETVNAELERFRPKGA